MPGYVEMYVSQQRRALESIQPNKVQKLIGIFKSALQQDRQIFVFGNGGSGCNASHFVTDLGKSASDKLHKRFRCLSLNDNTSWITAIGNDYSYEEVFLRQLQNYAKADDVVMVLSVSGNSPNLVRAIEWCNQNSIFTIGLLGGGKGALADLVDEAVIVDDTHYGRVEDCQMHICHMICYAFVEGFEVI